MSWRASCGPTDSEPNPAEYAKLQSGQTDAFLVHRIPAPPYRELTYWPFALGNRRGRTAFHVTPGPGAAGILEPDLERMREIVWKGRRYRTTLADETLAGYETIDVELRILDDFAQEHGLDHIDYLKIDVEGSEYEVLEGAQTMLPRTGVIRAEVRFVPMRKGRSSSPTSTFSCGNTASISSATRSTRHRSATSSA